jgi:hypothetical protein
VEGVVRNGICPQSSVHGGVLDPRQISSPPKYGPYWTHKRLEGIDEILTVTRLGLPNELRRSLACTNITAQRA